MKSLMFIILVGYAVKCDDASYYVIEIPEEPKQLKPFKVYWNVPTMQCRSKRIPFMDLFDKFGIIQNKNDSFRGEKIAILYDPGLFPALLKNETSGKFKFRNGGVPQEGDLEKHLVAFKNVMEQSIPDPNFNGIGIIDFESWRPVFRQNFGVLIPYKDISYQIERKLHWFWPEKSIQARARQRFEDAGKLFMASTLAVARQLRPHARWGYYAFPYCFNMASNNMAESCADGVARENDNIHWLWAESTALYPSAYFSRGLSPTQHVALVRGRVAEAVRVGGRHKPVLPYFWFRYRDGGFLPRDELDLVLETLYKSNASGFIIWGSSNDVNTVDKCQELLKYTEEILGPSIAKYTKYSSNNIMTTRNPLMGTGITTWRPILRDHLDVNESSSEPSINPDYSWEPPENYTQDIVHYVENEMKTKNITNTNDYKKPHLISIKKNTLLELLFNMLSYNANSVKESNSIENNNKANEKNQNSYSITGIPDNEIIENSSYGNTLTVNSFTTKNPFDSLLKDQKRGNPFKTFPNQSIVSTSTLATYTTRGYIAMSNNDSITNTKESSTTDNMKPFFDDKLTTKAPNFDIIVNTSDSIENLSSLNPSTDSPIIIYNITENTALTNIDDDYESLDNDTSQVDYTSSSTDPSNKYSLLDILTKPVTILESPLKYKSTESQSNDQKTAEDISDNNILIKSNYNEFESTTETNEIKFTEVFSDEDTTYNPETTTESMEFFNENNEKISYSNNINNNTRLHNFIEILNTDNNKKAKSNKNEEEVYTESTNSDTSTTENDIYILNGEEVPDRSIEIEEEEVFDETTTNAARQVGGTSYFNTRCYSNTIFPILTIILTLLSI